MQRTLVLLKPDAVQRGLVGRIVARLEDRGLRLVAAKMLLMDQKLAHRHYEDHVDKPFFKGLVEFMTSAPMVAMVLEGKNAVEVVRQMMGSTDSAKAAPGTIRGDLALDTRRNLVHGSDSPETAEREIALFFAPQEVLGYQRDVDRWIATGP
ncbi:MAG: nucleoside-diphosphate kinase [Chloroflexi bacterium]|nr:nucleoside-diphosphate kinase [Chloroflexota bacterium]